MSKTIIQQSEAVKVDSNLEEQTSLDSDAKLQPTEVEQEQTITELEKRLVREAVNAVEETKHAMQRGLGGHMRLKPLSHERYAERYPLGLHQEAIAAIAKNDNQAAVKAIERAVGELDIILARSLIKDASTESDREQAMQLLADALPN